MPPARLRPSLHFQELLGFPFPANPELSEVPEALKDTKGQQRSDKAWS